MAQASHNLLAFSTLLLATSNIGYKAIEVYRREGAFWKQYDYQEGDMIELISIGVRFSFERVYRGVRIP